MRTDGRWASGAVVAVVASGAALVAHLSLRASSTGQAPGLPFLVIGVAALALALWPLAARTTGVAALTAVLGAAQLGSHALAVAAAGQASDPLGLICCPAGAQVRPGPIGELTANAGWTLAAVQLTVCLALAVAIRGGRAGADLVSVALVLARAVLGAARRHLPALLVAWMRLGAVAVAPAPRIRPCCTTRLRDAGRVLAARTSRRGPPARLALTPIGRGAIAAKRVHLLAVG